MKKWLKYTIIGILLCMLGGASWFTYTFFIKDYETADQNVDEIVDSDFEIDLPEDNNKNMNSENNSEIISDEKESNNTESKTSKTQVKKDKLDGDKNNSIATKEKDNEETQNNQHSTSNTNSNNKNQKSNETSLNEVENDDNENAPQEKSNSQKQNKAKPDQTSEEDLEKSQTKKDSSNNKEEKESNVLTVEEIKAKYRSSFEALQDQATAKLNVLISYAHNEYKKKKNNGSKLSYGYFYNKYKAAAEKLEAKTDVTFNNLYAGLQNELVKNGHSKKEALEIKQYYDKQKSKRESALISKVLDKF